MSSFQLLKSGVIKKNGLRPTEGFKYVLPEMVADGGHISIKNGVSRHQCLRESAGKN